MVGPGEKRLKKASRALKMDWCYFATFTEHPVDFHTFFKKSRVIF